MRPPIVLPRSASLLLPLGSVLVLMALRSLLEPESFERWVMTEQGLVELGTVVLLIPAIVFGVRCLSIRSVHEGPLHTAWLAALTVACVYFAGEELSWGQHLFGWETPTAIEQLNDQQETNLHNMSSWLDQKPRLLLELWVLIGGVGVATWRWIRSRQTDWFWPGPELAVAGWATILVRMPERWDDWTGSGLSPWWSIRWAEIQEAFFAIFLLLYLWASWRRIRVAD